MSGTWHTQLVDPASQEAKRRLIVFCAVAVVLLAVVQATVYGTPILPVDDAYITLHNAITLRSGHDANYPGVAALVGATSAVHVVLVAILLTVAKGVWALWLGGWIAALAYGLGVLRLAFAQRASWPVALGALVLAFVIGKTPHQLCNGLETGLAMAGVVWTLALASEPRFERSRALGVMLGVLPFLRPELGALSALLVVLVAVKARQVAGSTRAAMPVIARFVGFAALGALPWVLLYQITTGFPLPNTIQAKRLFFAEGCGPRSLKLATTRDLLVLFEETLGYVSRGVLLLVFTRVGWVGIAFCSALVTAYYVNFPGALGHYEQRYLYILVPILLYALLSNVRHRSAFVRFAAIGLIVVGIDQSVWNIEPRWAEHLATQRFTRDELASVATWANGNLPKDSRLLIHDAGYISFATGFELYDMVGLKTPRSVPHHRDLTWKTCEDLRAAPPQDLAYRVNLARTRAIGDIMREVHPTHLVVLRGWETIYGIEQNLTALGWKMHVVRESPLGYEVYAIDSPPPT